MSEKKNGENNKSLESILKIGGLIGLFVDSITVLGWLFGNLSAFFPILITIGLIVSVFLANFIFQQNEPLLSGSLIETTRIFSFAIVLLPSSYFVYYILSLLYRYGIDFSVLVVTILIIGVVSFGAEFFLEIDGLLEAIPRLLKTSVYGYLLYFYLSAITILLL